MPLFGCKAPAGLHPERLAAVGGEVANVATFIRSQDAIGHVTHLHFSDGSLCVKMSSLHLVSILLVSFI
jgi:hypothetical protein